MIVLVIVGLVVVGWKLRKILPTADWSFGLDMSRTDAIVRRQDSLATSTHAAVLEKAALIALVGAIFAKVLEVESTGLRMFGATMLVVLANAGLSIWLARRAIEWASLALEFVVLGAVNTLLLSAYVSLVGDGDLDRSPAALVPQEPLQHGHHLGNPSPPLRSGCIRLAHECNAPPPGRTVRDPTGSRSEYGSLVGSNNDASIGDVAMTS